MSSPYKLNTEIEYPVTNQTVQLMNRKKMIEFIGSTQFEYLSVTQIK